MSEAKERAAEVILAGVTWPLVMTDARRDQASRQLAAALANAGLLADDDTARRLVEFSRMLDDSYPGDLCAEAVDRRRYNKIGEEYGEVEDAYSGMVGENPRKGVTHTREDLLSELLDVAMAAIGAYEHFDDHQGRALMTLSGHIAARHARLAAAIHAAAGVTPEDGR